MHDSDLIIALREEIGNPDLFTGREEEMDFLMSWVDLVKNELGDSQVLLARKRRGKTALIQRFYNVLYTLNDPKVIPIYFRVPEAATPYQIYAMSYFQNLVKQYLAFKLRRPELIQSSLTVTEMIELVGDDEILVKQIQGVTRQMDMAPDLGWHAVREFGHNLASSKDERIIQIIDEFQYMSKFVIHEGQPINLCTGYQLTGSSKVSPQIITGSYIGWLSEIVDHMVGRYFAMYLEPLSIDEALNTVYTYARVFKREISPAGAAYMAEICHSDPYYISMCFKTRHKVRGPLTRAAIREILDYETSVPRGLILRMWGDYILSAIERVNDRNAKKIILFLAKHSREFSRDEIREALKLDLTDHQLEIRINKLVKSDILAQGSSLFHYRGLGDPIFEMVFRRLYQAEIEGADIAREETDFHKQFASLTGKLAYAKGLLAEQRVCVHLFQIGQKRMTLGSLALTPLAASDQLLGPFIQIRKFSLHPQLDQRLEIDLFARAVSPEDPDLLVEVKDWEKPVGAKEVQEFIARKERIQPGLNKPSAFIFFSQNGFTEGQAQILADHQILACDGHLLANASETEEVAP